MARKARKPEFEEYEHIPKLEPIGRAGGWPTLWTATRTLYRRKAPYVKVSVTLRDSGGAWGRNLVYALEGRIGRSVPATSDGRSNPPLGPVQQAVGKKHLDALRAAVAERLESLGWCLIERNAPLSDYWQAPEGPALDARDERNRARAALRAAVEATVEAALDGNPRGRLIVSADGGRIWGVSAHRTTSGAVVVVLDPDPDAVERAQAEAEWKAEHGHVPEAELAELETRERIEQEADRQAMAQEAADEAESEGEG